MKTVRPQPTRRRSASANARTASSSMRSDSIPTTSFLIRTFSPSRPASKSTTTTRSTSSTRRDGSKKTFPAQRSRVAYRTFRFHFAATMSCARRCTRHFSITPARRAWTWASSMPACSRCTTRSQKNCSNTSKMCCSTADPMRPSVCSSLPSASRVRAARRSRKIFHGAKSRSRNASSMPC